MKMETVKFAVTIFIFLFVDKSTSTFQGEPLSYSLLTPKTILSRTSKSAVECIAGAEGIFPSRDDCTQYHHCIHYGGEWYDFLFQCAEGGYYHEKFQTCLEGACQDQHHIILQGQQQEVKQPLQ